MSQIHWNVLDRRERERDTHTHTHTFLLELLEEPWDRQSNRIYWLLPVSDWIDSLIGPGGLLLIVSHLLTVRVSFICMGGPGKDS
jgi:hypothetical protein